jgi:tetratricopeptide (TPR) repeat protein
LPPTASQRANVPPIHEARCAFANGDLTTTELICADVLAHAPDDGAAWALLTETALQRGRLDAALICANRAVALMPKDGIGLVLRAKCLLVAGEAGAALEAAEAASKMINNAPETLDACGAIFGLLGSHRKARQFFLRAVASRPDVPQYLFNLAATERMAGALDEAEVHCDAAIALDRNYGLAHYLRSDLRIQSAKRNHIKEMEALIHEGKLSGPSEVMLRFALGKECEDLGMEDLGTEDLGTEDLGTEDLGTEELGTEELGMYDRAFGHVDAGCRLQRRLIGYDLAAEIAEIDRIIRTHSRAWVDAAPSGYSASAPVFVAGLPRTGTTLVERIIASHPAMASAGETGAFAAELRRAMNGASSKADPAALGKRYIDQVTAFRVPKGVRFIDKTLQNYLYCGLIHTALPAAKIVLVQRHPLDACWGMYKAHFQGKFSFSYDQIELAEYYLAYRRLSRHWRTTLPADVLLEMNYEDIVSDQAAASRRLIGFVGLAWDDEVLRFHQSAAPSATASAVQVRRPIYSSSVGKWRHHAERLAPLRARLAREIPEAELA